MNRSPMIMAKHFDERARQSLRLPAEVWTAIDAARSKRAGNVSRNTWITEAILEKITRERVEQAMSRSGDGRDA
jgi:metal-responsive CopG/Arc/MetJ family transcriptional regulator